MISRCVIMSLQNLNIAIIYNKKQIIHENSILSSVHLMLRAQSHMSFKNDLLSGTYFSRLECSEYRTAHSI